MRGREPRDGDTARFAAVFQSTPPHGGRLNFQADCQCGYICFNPRPRMGGVETFDDIHNTLHPRSPPMRGRGLKQVH